MSNECTMPGQLKPCLVLGTGFHAWVLGDRVAKSAIGNWDVLLRDDEHDERHVHLNHWLRQGDREDRPGQPDLQHDALHPAQ